MFCQYIYDNCSCCRPLPLCNAVQLLTRLHQFTNNTGMVVPLLDMGNHHSGCAHTHVPEPCDAAEGLRRLKEGLGLQPLAPSAGTGVYGAAAAAAAAAADGGSSGSSGMSNQCIVWRAQEFVPAGGEVCISYKTLFQDRALLQYGFLQVRGNCSRRPYHFLYSHCCDGNAMDTTSGLRCTQLLCC